MNKRGFLARDYLVAILVATAVMGLLYLSVNGFATEYENTDVIDSDFNSTYNQYSSLSDTADSLFSEASGDEGLSFTGSLTLLFGATTTVIQLVFGTLAIPGDMMKQFALDVGAPKAIADILFTLPLIIITIIIVFVVISSITQRKL